jgi:hypothetical protein
MLSWTYRHHQELFLFLFLNSCPGGLGLAHFEYAQWILTEQTSLKEGASLLHVIPRVQVLPRTFQTRLYHLLAVQATESYDHFGRKTLLLCSKVFSNSVLLLVKLKTSLAAFRSAARAEQQARSWWSREKRKVKLGLAGEPIELADFLLPYGKAATIQILLVMTAMKMRKTAGS